MKKILLLSLSFILLGALNAQWSQLTSPDLSCGEFNSIVYTGGSTVIAVNEGGVFRSADNGLTWNLSVNGLDTARLEVNDITVIKSVIPERNEVWISTGDLYKSTDDGLSWTKMTLTGLNSGGFCQNISRVGSRLIIAYSEWDGSLMTNIVKLCYSDDGVNWSYGTTLNLDDTAAWWSFIKDDNDKAVYMVESHNDGTGDIWYTTTGSSKTLHPVTGLVAEPDINNRSFSIDPQGNNLFFRDEGAGKYYYYDPIAETWSERMNGIGVAGFNIAQVFDIHSLGNLVITTVLLMNAGSDILIELYSSTDNALNWNSVTVSGVTFPMFEDQMITAGSDRIIGTYFNSRLAYSDNAGQTWSIISSLFSGEFKSFVSFPGGDILTGTLDQEKGLIKSSDNGNTWTQHNGNLPNFSGIYFVEDLFIASINVLYVIAQENPFDETQYLFISADEGVTYTKLTTTPEAKRIAFVGRHGTWPILRFTNNSGVEKYYYSDDAGTTWTNISDAITALSIERVQGIRGNGTLLFLFGEVSGKTRVYLSQNNGTSFSDITFNLDVPSLWILVSRPYDWDDIQSAIGSFNNNGTEFYVALRDYSTFPAEVSFYKLNSEMNEWIKAGVSGIGFPVDVKWHSLRAVGGVFYFTTGTGVFASINNCNTWVRVWNNEGFQKGITPTYFIQNSYGLFVVTTGNGIWRAPITLPVFTTLAVDNITDVQAEGGATLTSTGGLPFGGKGFCWAEHAVPTTSDYTVYVGNTWGSFTGTLSPLTPSTPYYVRAFIQSPKGLTYGNEVSFTTSVISSLEEEVASDIMVYPNPADEALNVKTEIAYSMHLMDITGRTVISEQLYSGISSFNISKLPAGLYFLKLTGVNGDVSIVKVLVK